MIRARLKAALDFAKRKGVPHEVATYRREGKWFVVQTGPGYCNTHEVLDFDDEGLAKLQALEAKSESPTVSSTGGIPMSEYAELESFDTDFKASQMAGRSSGIETLPDADYDFVITKAEMRRTPQTNDLILSVYVRVLGGPQDGKEVEKPYFFNRQKSVDILGGDLMTLGFDADKWTLAHGRKFSQELPRVVPKLAGIRFRGTKKASQGDDNKTYHNLYINARLAEAGVTPGAATVPPLDSDIPF
jgi:hypothetical protein